MPLPFDFLASLTCPHPKVVFDRLLNGPKATKKAKIWTWRAEISPADFYCYLRARFGKSNGPQSFLRRDDSDNLIHWHWVLDHPTGELQFLGMTFRTEVWISVDFDVTEIDSSVLATLFKADFSIWGQGMSEIRNGLERWTEFVNPFQRLASTVEKMTLPPEMDLENLWSLGNSSRLAHLIARLARGLPITPPLVKPLPLANEVVLQGGHHRYAAAKATELPSLPIYVEFHNVDVLSKIVSVRWSEI